MVDPRESGGVGPPRLLDLLLPEERGVLSLRETGVPVTAWGIVVQALVRNADRLPRLSDHVESMPGMSGVGYRRLVNALVATRPGCHYLELGSYKGSTLCSALWRNDVTATAIDDWSQFGGPRDEFMVNLAESLTEMNRVRVLQSRWEDVGFERLLPADVLLIDGPHSATQQYRSSVAALACAAPEFVLVVDDWNWAEVREATLKALSEREIAVDFAWEVRTSAGERQTPPLRLRHGWHNGYLVAACIRQSTNASSAA